MSPPWIQLEISSDAAGALKAAVIGGTGRVSTPAVPLVGIDLPALEQYAGAVQRTARRRLDLSAELRQWGQGLYSRVFAGEIGALVERLRGQGRGAPLLVRVVCRDPRLRAIPWESMAGPGATDAPLAYHPAFRLVRDVVSMEPAVPREVRGAVRVLAVTTAEFAPELEALRGELQPLIAAGQVEWLDPVVGDGSQWRPLQQATMRVPRPHVLHFIGHGRLNEDRPQLLLSPSGDDEHWVGVDLVANTLANNAGDEMRLVYLQSCGGADPGSMGSAADLVAGTGVEGVVAHLWPVDLQAATVVARTFYSSLTTSSKAPGDLASALNAACLDAAGELSTAEFLAPVLFLRGEDPVLFDFGRRQVVPVSVRTGSLETSGPDARIAGLAADLRATIVGGATVLVGPGVDPEGKVTGTRRLREEVVRVLPDPAGGLVELMQRVELEQEREELRVLVSDALTMVVDEGLPIPPVLDGLTGIAPKGLWLTLLWLPLAEEALALHHPDVDIYVLQPMQPGGLDKLRVYHRAAGERQWRHRREGLTERVDLTQHLVVVRLYGGFAVYGQGLAGNPVLTEDDHLSGLDRIDSLPEWVLAWLRQHPAVFCGLDPLEWHHRQLLRRLADNQPLVRGSFASIPDAKATLERRYWESPDGPAGRAGGLTVVELEDLAAALRVVRR